MESCATCNFSSTTTHQQNTVKKLGEKTKNTRKTIEIYRLSKSTIVPAKSLNNKSSV